MKPSLYIETSFISYVAAEISEDQIIAGRQLVSKEWWKFKRNDFSLFISELVFDEILRGDANKSQTRLELIRKLPLLKIDDRANDFAQRLVVLSDYPTKAYDDALYISVAIVNQMEYILTWNFRHIANPIMWGIIKKVCANLGYDFPVICTASELLGA